MSRDYLVGDRVEILSNVLRLGGGIQDIVVGALNEHAFIASRWLVLPR
jgi:hypothetical protein